MYGSSMLNRLEGPFEGEAVSDAAVIFISIRLPGGAGGVRASLGQMVGSLVAAALVSLARSSLRWWR